MKPTPTPRTERLCREIGAYGLMKDMELMERELAEARAECDDLRRWKKEMLQVECEWNPQEIARLLTVPYGRSIRAAIEPSIRELRTECARLREALASRCGCEVCMRSSEPCPADRSDAHAALHPAPEGAPVRPKIVCLCGSTKFFLAFQEASLQETLKGHIVLSIGCNLRDDNSIWADKTEPDAIKIRLDELHKRKIDLADEVLILNIGGYIGDSTRSELEYAIRSGKAVRYLEDPKEAQDSDSGGVESGHALNRGGIPARPDDLGAAHGNKIDPTAGIASGPLSAALHPAPAIPASAKEDVETGCAPNDGLASPCESATPLRETVAGSTKEGSKAGVLHVKGACMECGALMNEGEAINYAAAIEEVRQLVESRAVKWRAIADGLAENLHELMDNVATLNSPLYATAQLRFRDACRGSAFALSAYNAAKEGEK